MPGPYTLTFEVRESRHPRQLLPAEKLERRAAAGRDVRHLVRNTRLRDGGDGITAADDCRALHCGDGLRDADRAGGELVDLEDAHRAVPDDGLRGANDVGVVRDGLRTDV